MSQDLAQLMQLLVTSQTQLQTIVANMASNQQSKTVAKPSNYDGKRGDDARRFLAAFNLYADSVPALKAEYKKKITSAISFLEGDAAVWATPYSELIHESATDSNVAYPFDTWAEFESTFKSRFETTDATADAKDALHRLYQGRSTVGTYAATFKQYGSRTGYSDQDLRDRFYDHLADRIKDALVHTERPTGTLDELMVVAIAIDNRQLQRDREKKPRNNFTSTPTHSGASHAPAPFVPPARDPMAMDIDASTGRTPDDYRRAMMGRCYGCGSKEHRKAEGRHERDICGHCGMVGHQEKVCRGKYLGRPARQRVAATAEATPSSSDTAAVLAKLLADQKALADQISSIQSHF